jgi:hypothetical protein
VPERLFVTVFTITFNQRAKVLRLADDLARQRYPAYRFELVVLDDGSTDGTSDALHGVAPELPYDLSVLRREREGDYLSAKRWNECIAAGAPTTRYSFRSTTCGFGRTSSTGTSAGTAGDSWTLVTGAKFEVTKRPGILRAAGAPAWAAPMGRPAS